MRKAIKIFVFVLTFMGLMMPTVVLAKSEKTVRISGLVSADNKPVVFARLALRKADYSYYAWFTLGDVLDENIKGTGGKYFFDVPVNSGPYIIDVYSTGYKKGVIETINVKNVDVAIKDIVLIPGEGHVLVFTWDVNEKEIADVDVTVKNNKGKVVATCKTDKWGNCYLPDRPYGKYTIIVKKDGYKTTSEKMVLKAGQRAGYAHITMKR